MRSSSVAGDVQMLRSIAQRLHESLRAAEQRAAIEQLAHLGHRLARHLELEPLLQEAVELLSEITDSDSALLLTIEQGKAGHRAATGAAPRDAEHWPMQPDEQAAWHAACRGEPYIRAEPRLDRPGVVLCLPLVHNGLSIGLLYATRMRTVPFPKHVLEATEVFASYVAAAVANAQLYRELANSESNLRLITDAISDMVVVVDRAGTFSYASPSCARELQYQPANLLGRSILDFLHPDHQDRFQQMLTGAEHRPTEDFRVRTGEDTWVWVETACRPSSSASDQLVLSSRVIGRRKELEEKLLHKATHDALTGLANRELARQHLDAALNDRHATHIGLLFCDLDNFKSVNDRLGHEAGDQLLQQVARRLRDCVRGEDLLARLGGDEFVMVLHDVAMLDDVSRVGERVLEALSRSFLLCGEQVPVSASVGGVISEPGRTTAEALLRDADAAMYDAKEHGRGRVAVFDHAAAQRSLDRLALRSELPTALQRGELSLHYQPIVTLDSNEIVAFEALLRWTHPHHGAIPPGVFVPLAEETEAINPIGQWVIEQAAQQLAEWQLLAPERGLWMSVNLSAVQLRNPALVARTVEAARRADIDPRDLCLEVTEDRRLGHAALERLKELRGAGFRLALDDFGTFQSNFDRLRQCPVDHLKIDQIFVGGLTTDDIDQGIVTAVVALGDALALGVVAEGVETDTQRAELLRLGCRLGQGFLFSRPVPAHVASGLLNRPPTQRRHPAPSSPARTDAPG